MSDDQLPKQIAKRKRTAKVMPFPLEAPLLGAGLNDILVALARFEGNAILAREEFLILNQDTEISVEAVQKLAVQYRAQISARAEELKNGDNPLSSNSFRMKMLWYIFKRASEVKARRFRKNAKGELESIVCDDPVLQLEVLKLCERADMAADAPTNENHKTGKQADGRWANQTNFTSGVKFNQA